MHVGLEVAIGALHPFREMRVLEMNRLGELHRVLVRNFIVVEIEQVAVAIFLEHRAEHPAMAVIISELRFLQLRIQFGDFFQKFQIAPQPARGGGFRIVLHGAHHLRVGRILLLFRIHEFTVALLIPPDVAEVGIHKEIALVHVAVHALRGRDGAGELVFDRMAALVFANRLVVGETQTLMAEF